jgi:hypothetical protein
MKYDLMTSETLIVPIDQESESTAMDEQSSNAATDEAMQTMQHVSLTSSPSSNSSASTDPSIVVGTGGSSAQTTTLNSDTIVRKSREESEA